MKVVERTDWPEPVREALERVERSIRDLDHEELFVLDSKTGEVLGHEVGIEHSVNLPCDPKDKVVTHNHPIIKSYLSNNDVSVSARYDVEAIRAVQPNGEVHELRRPSGGWVDWEKIWFESPISVFSCKQKDNLEHEWPSKVEKAVPGAEYVIELAGEGREDVVYPEND